MLSKSQIQALVIAVAAGSLLLGFQNCSKYSFENITPADSKASSLSTDQLPDNSQTPVDQTEAQPPVVANPPAVTNPPVVTNPPSEQESEACVEWAEGHKEDHGDGHQQDAEVELGDGHEAKAPKIASASGVSGSCKKKEGSSPAKCYVNDEEDQDENDSELCSLDPDKIKMINSAGSALKVMHLRGKTILTPEIVGADHLDKIEDVRGKLVVCDLKVGSIVNTRGKVVLENSSAELIQDHRGIAVLNNSAVDHCVDIKGVVAIKGSGVCHSVENSKSVVSVKRRL